MLSIKLHKLMNFPKTKIGIVLFLLGAAATAYSFSSNQVNDLTNGLLVGAGLGFILWGWIERKYDK